MARVLGHCTWSSAGPGGRPIATIYPASERRRSAREDPHAPPRSSDRIPSESAEVMRVLLVEDNPGDQELVREALDQALPGATLVAVERIADAVGRAREGSFDVVLLDLSLPDASELQGVRRLRAALPGLPIVVLTSLEDDRVAAGAVGEGAQDYLVKGEITAPLLVRALRYAVERHRHAERSRLLAAEHALRLAAEAEERRFRAVLDQVQDYAIFVLDAHGRVRSWSTGARLLAGWAPEEVLGRSYDALFPAEDVAGGKPGAELEQAAREGRFEQEDWRLRKDGSRFLANVVVTALRGERGDLLGFVEVTRDVTEQRRSERNAALLVRASQELASELDPLALLERLVQLAVPAIADLCGVDLATDDGSSSEFVATAAVDAAREQAFRESRRVAPVRAGASSRVVETLRRGEVVYFPEVGEEERAAITRSSEHLQYVRRVAPRSFMAIPLRSRGGAYGAVLFAMTEPGRRFDRVDLDVAVELVRRAELAIDNARLFADLQRSVRVREDVLAIVSHDMRTPLTAIQLSAGMALRALDEGRDDARLRGQLSAILRGTRRADVLLRDLLDMASIRAGKLSVRMSTASTRALLAEAVQAGEPLAHVKGVTLAWRDPADLPVRCDGDRVLQVLTNLVGNAIKFCTAGDRVEVGVDADARTHTFTVSDSGPGIAEDVLPHVFEAYWSTARQPAQGVGLGLFITKGIVEAHGGRVWIESQPGRGTTVRFTIPAAEA